MKKYTIKYILYIALIIFLLTFIAVAIAINLERFKSPWSNTVIFITSLTGMIHIISSTIYEKRKDTKGNINIPNITIGIIFIISTLCQIICTIMCVIEAYKRFNDIRPIEFIISAIFIFASTYGYKKSAYTLINMEKKNEK